MASLFNFDDEHNGAEVQLAGTHCTQETTVIQQNISLFVEVMDSLQSDEDVRQNELLQEIYSRQFNGMQEKITVLINNYQDNGDILAMLLDIHDWMEGVLAQYLRRVGGSPLKDSQVPTSTGEIMVAPVQVRIDNSSSGDSDDDSTDEDSDSGSDNDDKLARKRSTSRRDKGKGRNKSQEGVVPPLSTTTTFAVTNEDTRPHTDSSSPRELAPLTRPGFKIAEGPGECPICCEDEVPASDLFIFDACTHQYCRECLQGYFANLIQEGKVLDMTCPSPGCKTLVEYQHVQAVATHEVFSKYEEFTFIASLNADPSVKWCPKPGCGNAIIGDPENPRCQCTEPSCRYEFCFLCSEPWHQDATCEQYQQWKVENGMIDTKFTTWAKKNTKKCPQCKTMIEKIAGCNHMTCSSCKYEFCWLCSGKYSSNHFDVFNVLGCPGMQSGAKQFGFARRIGMRALIGTGLVIGGILGTALAIPAAVVAGPIYGGYKLHQRRKRSSRRRRNYYY